MELSELGREHRPHAGPRLPARLGGACGALRPFSFRYQRSLGLYGKLFDSTVGLVGRPFLVMFWVLRGADAPVDPHPPPSSRMRR